jgi:hypothetical protein
MDQKAKHICVCKYPIILLDNREGSDVEYFSLPFQVISDEMEGEPFVPEMEVVKTESLTGIIGTYMKVTWKKAPSWAKKYDITGHIVLAGCPEDARKCDVKSIFEVYHPIDEWIQEHVIELNGNKQNK